MGTVVTRRLAVGRAECDDPVVCNYPGQSGGDDIVMMVRRSER